MVEDQKKEMKKKIAESLPKPVTNPDFVHVTVYQIPSEIKEKFKRWCADHAGNRFNTGLSLLLERADYSDTLDTILRRLDKLENKERLNENVIRERKGNGD